MKRIYILILLIFLFLVCIAEAQKKPKQSKKASSKPAGKSKPSSKSPKEPGKPPVSVDPVSGGPSESLKLAEELVVLANRLLKAVKAGEQTPVPMCPNGFPKMNCSPRPCDKWTCSNIIDAKCKQQCHTCEPKFYIGGNDVTHICKTSERTATQTQVATSPPRDVAPSTGSTGSRNSGSGTAQQMPPMSGMPMLFSENSMPMAGPPGMEFMPNFENFPPGMSPMQFFHHLQNMQPENQGSRSAAN